jgi:hypothetical protein
MPGVDQGRIKAYVFNGVRRSPSLMNLCKREPNLLVSDINYSDKG